MRPSSPLRSDLRAITADGVFYSVMLGVGESYLPAFVLALGLGEVLAGLVVTVPFVAGAVLQLASPWAVRRLGSHRRWVVACALAQALCFLPLAAAALLRWRSIAAIMGIATLYWGAGLATSPAWNAWVSTLVPRRIRTRYFAGRNRLSQGGVLAGLLAGGLLLQLGDRKGETLTVFAALFLLAAASRLGSTACLASQREPAPRAQSFPSLSPLQVMRRATRGDAGSLLLFLVLMQFALQIAVPFFTPYALERLGLSYADYVTLVALPFLARAAAFPILGRFGARHGVHRLLAFGAAGLAPVPLLWILAPSLPFLALLQIVAGVAWGAFELASFLLFFEALQDTERTSVLSAYNFAYAVSTVCGSLVGAALLSHYDHRIAYMVVFAASTLARLLALPLLPRRLPRPSMPETLVTRTLAVRPSAGAIERPILASMEAGPERER